MDESDDSFYKKFNTGCISIPWQNEMIETECFKEINVFGPDSTLPPDLMMDVPPPVEMKGCFPFRRKKKPRWKPVRISTPNARCYPESTGNQQPNDQQTTSTVSSQSKLLVENHHHHQCSSCPHSKDNSSCQKQSPPRSVKTTTGNNDNNKNDHHNRQNHLQSSDVNQIDIELSGSKSSTSHSNPSPSIPSSTSMPTNPSNNVNNVQKTVNTAN